MRQAESVRNAGKICPVCNQEGQRITCISGNKSEVIFYHPKKIFRTICHFVAAGNDCKDELIEEKAVNQDEADTVEAR